MMRFLFFALMILAAAGDALAVSGTVYRAVMTDTNGVVVLPVDFKNKNGLLTTTNLTAYISTNDLGEGLTMSGGKLTATGAAATASFSQLTGNPDDNAALASRLNGLATGGSNDARIVSGAAAASLTQHVAGVVGAAANTQTQHTATVAGQIGTASSNDTRLISGAAAAASSNHTDALAAIVVTNGADASLLSLSMPQPMADTNTLVLTGDGYYAYGDINGIYTNSGVHDGHLFYTRQNPGGGGGAVWSVFFDTAGDPPVSPPNTWWVAYQNCIMNYATWTNSVSTDGIGAYHYQLGYTTGTVYVAYQTNYVSQTLADTNGIYGGKLILGSVGAGAIDPAAWQQATNQPNLSQYITTNGVNGTNQTGTIFVNGQATKIGTNTPWTGQGYIVSNTAAAMDTDPAHLATVLTSAATVTITRANGAYLSLVQTNNATVAFDLSTYPVTHASYVSLSLSNGSYSTTFDALSITNMGAALTLQTNRVNALIFHKPVGGVMMRVKQ